MARRKTIRPIDLTAAVDELLKEYGDDVFEVTSESVEEVTDESIDKLKSVSFSSGGAYSASWVYDDKLKTRTKSTKIVHNEEHYRLTHLLEKGHLIKNGTQRTFGHTSANPHIAPVNDWASDELPKRFRRKVESLR